MRRKIPWDKARPGFFALTEWEVDPARSALLILDMQHGYTDTEAGIGKILKPAYPEIYGYYYRRVETEVLPAILKLQEFFRSHQLEVVYTRLGYQLPEAKDLPPWSNLKRRAILGERASCFFMRGSPEYELAAKLEPLASELVVDKNSLNPFNSTALDQILRNMNVENLILTGVQTNGAVESTARSAAERGYNVIMVEDACAAYCQEDHQHTLLYVNSYVTKTTDEITGIFSSPLTLY
ncbi:MAG: cysteine hydrolase [Chloroflexi bacterium]|nr:cysteine hydrolase [Chloroflexota bacterium]